MEVRDTCRPGTPHLDVHGFYFLELDGRCDAKTAEPRSVPDRTHSHRLFYERHLPSNLACLAVIFSNCFFSCPCAQQSPSPELEPNILWQWLFGSDGDPTPRGVVGFVFPRWCCATSQCRSQPSVRTRVGSGEAGSLSVDWCSWENIRRGIHGARRSTETGSARWFLFPTNTWEPPLLTWVV